VFSSGKRTSFQIVRKFPVSANLSIQSTGHISSICSCSGILLILCEQVDQHYFTLFWIKLNMYGFCSDFICYWVQEFIKDNWPWCWQQTGLILPSLLILFLFWQLEHYWLPSDSFNLVIWSGTKIQWDGATRKCHLALVQLQGEL